MKLNLGCGNKYLEGYTNCDLYNTSVCDKECDIRSIPYNDESVTEIIASHVLEHLPKNDVIVALKSCYRVLIHGGILKLEVPDLNWVLKDFLDAPENQKWGHRIERIYGLQCNMGEFHATGFTKERLIHLLADAMFIPLRIESVDVEHHDRVIQVEALKE